MKAKYINPFLKATLNLFDEMLGIVPSVGEPYILTKGQSHRWDISGVIGLSGGTNGVVAISLTKILAVKLLSKMGIDQADTESNIGDLVGELVNIITSNAKTDLEKYKVKVSVPSVVQGKNHRISWPYHSVPVIVIPFTTVFGPFILNVSLKDQQQLF